MSGYANRTVQNPAPAVAAFCPISFNAKLLHSGLVLRTCLKAVTSLQGASSNSKGICLMPLTDLTLLSEALR